MWFSNLNRLYSRAAVMLKILDGHEYPGSTYTCYNSLYNKSVAIVNILIICNTYYRTMFHIYNTRRVPNLARGFVFVGPHRWFL